MTKTRDLADLGGGFIQAGTGAVQRTVESKLQDVVSVKDFGAVGDGVTDDTEKIRAAHVAANLIGATVSYRGLNSVAIEADAQIPVKTSVEFYGCSLVLLNGINVTPSFSTFNTTYVVTDDACPLVSVTGAVAASDLKAGSYTPTKGLFDGPGYASLTCAFAIPNRAETGTQNYKQTFKVNREGRVSNPLSVDLQAQAASITVNYRKASADRLTINGLTVTETGWNNQRVFYIQRCNVSILNTTILYTTAGTYDNIDNLIRVEDSSDVLIDNFITTGRPVTATVGSYALALEGAADIFVSRMNAITGWGCMGNNHVNGLYVTESVVNRIESHNGAHNLFVSNCDLHEIGVVYGWGGGVIQVSNCRLHQAAVATREDYSGQFFGSILVSDCVICSNFTSKYYVVDLTTTPLGASTAIYAPRTISITGITRINPGSTNVSVIAPLGLTLKDASSVVYAPSDITIGNIQGYGRWYCNTEVDWLGLEASPESAFQTNVTLYNITGSEVPSSTNGFIQTATAHTPATQVRLYLRATNCHNLNIVLNPHPTICFIKLNGCTVNGVQVDTVATTQPQVILIGCSLINQASGYTNAPIGGGATGTDRFTLLQDCVISSQAWDLSKVSSINGSRFAGTPSALLPTDDASFFTNSLNYPVISENGVDMLYSAGNRLNFKLSSSVFITENNYLQIYATSDTQLTLAYRGSDGTTRTTTLTIS